MTSILARHRRLLRDETLAMTAAQRTAVRLTIALNPATHDDPDPDPDLAAAIAADAGFPINDTVRGHPSLFKSEA